MSKKPTTPAEVITEAAAEETVAATKVPYFDHTECTHEKTPKARAKCRASGDAAVHYGRDPKVPAQRKAKKAKVADDAPADALDELAARKAAKKARKAAKTAALREALVTWSTKGTGAITHWAILVDDEVAAACGARISSFATPELRTEVTGCQKCRATGAPEAV